MKKIEKEWQLYRTRFLVKAKQLSRGMRFVDALGHEHCGAKGDYLVESCDGSRRITPRKIFEDVYVVMAPISQPALSDSPAQTIVLTASHLRKKGCGKAVPRSGIPEVNRLRYNM